MGPVEKLEAAITKLEAQRDLGTRAPWFLTYQNAHHPRVWGNRDEDSADRVAQSHGRGNAELILTLHRTIDAQLAILRDMTDRYVGRVKPDWVPIAPGAINAVALADAILGGA